MKTTDAEVAALRAEVKELRTTLDRALEEIRDLRQWFSPISREEEGAPPVRGVCITCHKLNIAPLDGSDCPVAMLGSNAQGAVAEFFSAQQEEAYASLSFDSASRPEIHLVGADGKTRLHAGVDDNDHGFVVVNRPGSGEPGAILRSHPQGGAVGVFSPEGNVRAMMLTNKEGRGEAAVLDHENRMAAKLVSMAAGGACVCFAAAETDQTACAVLSAEAGGGQMCLTRANAKDGLILRTSEEGNMLSVSAPGNDGGLMLAATAVGSSCRILDAAGKPAISALCHAAGNDLDLYLPDGRRSVRLNPLETGGSFAVFAAKGPASCHCFALNGTAMLDLRAGEEKEDKTCLTLAQSAEQSIILSRLNGPLRAGLTVNLEDGHFMLAGPGESNSTVQLGIGDEGGGLAIKGAGETPHVKLGSTENGGRLVLSNELGIPRVEAVVVDDGGGLRLRWGGTPGVIAVAGARGGAVVVNDAKGETLDGLPSDEAAAGGLPEDGDGGTD